MHAKYEPKPYIAHVVEVLRRYMSKLGKDNWIVVKRVFRYFCGTRDHAIYYQGRSRLDKVLYVLGFVDV